MALKEFLTGLAMGVPAGRQTYEKMTKIDQEQQALDQTKAVGALNRQKGMMKGLEANRAFLAVGGKTKDGTPAFEDNTDYPTDFVQTVVNAHKSEGGQNARDYIQPLNKRDPQTGEDLFSVRLNGQASVMRASQIPGVELGKGALVPSLKTLPASQTSELADTTSLEDLLGRIKAQVAENPSFIGRTATVEAMKMNPLVKKFQSLTGIETLANDPKAGALLRDLQSLKTLRSFSLGGKQLTPTEVEQLSKLVPNPDSTLNDYNAQVVRFEQEIQTILRNREKAFQQAGYTTPDVARPQVPGTQSSARERLLQKMRGQ